MKPAEIEAGELFSNESKQYWVPRYQRRYEWGTDKLHGLWQDLGLLLSGANKGKHFLGIILGSPSSNPGSMPSIKVEVIDGQQRITTLLILLVAIMDHVNEQKNQKGPQFKSHPLYFLYDRFNNSYTKHKILELQSSDGKELDDVVAGKWRKKYGQPNKSSVLEAYTYFRYCLWIGKKSFNAVDEYVLPEAKTQKDKSIATPELLWAKIGETSDPKIEPDPLSECECTELESVIKKQIVFLNIHTEPTDQNAVVIFDSINGKRLEFSQWDYARSYFFRTIGNDEELFDRWDQTQDDLGDALKETGQRKRRGNTPVNDEFLYNMMILEASKSGERANKNRSFLQLKEHLRKTLNDGNEPTADNLRDYSNNVLLPTAEVYKSIISPQKYPLKNPSDQSIPQEAVHILSQIQCFSKGPADPAVMLCLVDWHKGLISNKELVESLKGIETFLARYFLAGLDFSPLRSKFMQMIGTASQSGSHENRPSLLLAELKRQSPADDVIFKAHTNGRLQSVYSDAPGAAQRIAAILRGIEREIGGPAVNSMPLGNGTTDFNVDHILPQSCREGLNMAWKEDVMKWGLSNDEIDRLRERVDCLGNLALHASYSNKSDQDAGFEYKKLAISGKVSYSPKKGKKTKAKPVVLVSHAQDICLCTSWTAEDIDKRTVKLLGEALEYWTI